MKVLIAAFLLVLVASAATARTRDGFGGCRCERWTSPRYAWVDRTRRVGHAATMRRPRGWPENNW